jgi:non-specific serine/threonine protein kinase
MQTDSGLIDQYQIDPLNAREMEILGLVSKGLSNGQIAQRLSLSQETIKWYNKHIFSKLGVGSRTQAVAAAAELGLLGAREAPEVKPEISQSHNLPAPLTSFVGREKELKEIAGLLASNRLILLTGPGGSGKTRLALQVARSSAAKYRNGAWLVELASLADPAQVVHAVAEVFQLSSNPREPLEAIVRRFLSQKHLLLILDNFEHLLEAAPLVGEILAAAPRVTILATSRERLNVYGETEYQIHPLSLPDATRRETPQQILNYDSIRLFMQRARAVRPDLSLDETQAHAVAKISHRLDGLPLALELAATQVKILTLPQLAEQLEQSLIGLASGPRDVPHRQRTLRATIEWSYSLLDDAEKTLFARAGIFKGGGTLHAIEAVCADSKLKTVRECLTSLVNKNMIAPREGRDGELYFILLETIREFALERLEAGGELEHLRRKHAEYYVNLVERANAEIRSERQVYWFARLRAERENVRAILQWVSGRPEMDADLRLVAALSYFWYYDGHSIEEARRWAELALEKSKNAPPRLAAGVMITAGRLCLDYSTQKQGRAYLKNAHDLYRSIGDEHQAAWSQIYLGSSYSYSREDAVEGLRICAQGLDYFRETRDKLGIAQALNIMGELSRLLGDHASAREYYEECLLIARETGEKLRIAMQYGNLGFVAYHQNQPEELERAARAGVRLFQEMGSDFGVLATLPILAGGAILTGQAARAARLMSASLKLLEDIGARHQLTDRIEFDLFIEEIRRALSEEAFQTEWQRGAAMSYEELLAFALPEDG